MRIGLALASAVLAAFSSLAATPAKPAWESDPAFVKQKQEAVRLEHSRGQILFAADAWHKANKVAGGKCTECYLGAIRVYQQMGDTKAALKEAAAMEAAADTPEEKSTAELQEGRTLIFAAGDEKFKPAPLEQAHTALALAVSNDGSNRSAMFLDGLALARLGRNADATAAFQNYAAHSKAAEPMHLRAVHFAENPELARHRMAPPVLVNTLAGKQFNLDNMHGRVVLIDFWATWCGPCNEELPHLQKLAKKYANDPFEVISISWDSDESKWKNFIAAHNMTWNQYRDADHSFSKSFSVDAIPHYFTIDSDGVLTAENIGSGSMSDGRIDKLVQRAREAQRAETSLASASSVEPNTSGSK